MDSFMDKDIKPTKPILSKACIAGNMTEETYFLAGMAVHKDRKEYISGMEEYLANLKSMGHEQARASAFKNLMGSGIIDENGEFAEHFQNA